MGGRVVTGYYSEKTLNKKEKKTYLRVQHEQQFFAFGKKMYLCLLFTKILE